MEIIRQHALQDKLFANAFSVIDLSLQSSIYIELFKLFDQSGDDVKHYNVEALLSQVENPKYKDILQPYRNDIESLRCRRNYFFGHDMGNNGEDVFCNHPISHKIQDLLKEIAAVCHAVNKDLSVNISYGNCKEFDGWCAMSCKALNDMLCNNTDEAD